MRDWDKYVLNKLIDKYERSQLYYHANKRNQSFSLDLKKTLPQYASERSLDYLSINEALKYAESKGFLLINWQHNRRDHIITKVTLNLEDLPAVYRYLKRKPKDQKERELLQLIEVFKEKYKETEITLSFLAYLKERILSGKSVKVFIDLSDLRDFKDLITALGSLEANHESFYLREFSIRHFGDSKVFEKLTPRVVKIIKLFSPQYEDLEKDAVLEEFFVFSNPNYVYFKGDTELQIGETKYNLSELSQGLAISGDDLEKIQFTKDLPIKTVLTIENLTSFTRTSLPNTLIIYLGGYHNKNRRELLKKIYKTFPTANYLHFGDIDVGGFLIYLNLIEKTGIDFKAFKMGIPELKTYRKFCKELTKNDQSRLEKLITRLENNDENIELLKVLKYMWENKIKLEQEVIEIENPA